MKTNFKGNPKCRDNITVPDIFFSMTSMSGLYDGRLIVMIEITGMKWEEEKLLISEF